MTYEAIINGATGVNYFGGANKACLTERDERLGYNWTFWDRTLKPLIAEINEKSPLAGALVAPDSKMPVKAKDKNIELCVREVGKDVFVLACSKDPQKTSEIEFTGLPKEAGEGVVLYESPRKVAAKDGAFKDWFAPYEVHVYKFSRP
jgi:hypothetical protein